jgi:hypothetical protein
MSDDRFDLDVAAQLRHDLLVARRSDSDSIEVSGELEEQRRFRAVLGNASRGLFLQTR